MGKGLPRSLARGGAKEPTFKKTFVAKALPIVVDGATGIGFGSAVLGGLPQGNLVLLGAVSYMKFTTADTGVTTTFTGNYGIGSTPADDGTITGADVDVVTSTALSAATARVSPRTRGTKSAGLAGAVLDNTDGSLELNLNLLIADATISADDCAFTADGELQLLFAVLGDD